MEITLEDPYNGIDMDTPSDECIAIASNSNDPDPIVDWALFIIAIIIGCIILCYSIRNN